MFIDYLSNKPDVADTLTYWILTEWLGPMGFSWQDAAKLIEKRCQRNRLPIALVGMEAGRPVGMASLIDDVMPDNVTPVACLTALYVSPSWRRRGLGTELCGRVLAEAQRLDIPTVGLYTVDSESFYARLGWVKHCDAIVDLGSRSSFASFMNRPVAGCHEAANRQKQTSLIGQRHFCTVRGLERADEDGDAIPQSG